MTTFVLSQAYIDRLRKLILGITLPMIVIVVPVLLYVDRSHTSDWVPSIVAMTVLFIVFIPTLWWTVRKQIRRARSFRLVIDGESITRTQEGYDDVTVRGTAIQRLVLIKRRGLRIYTEGSQPSLLVPDGLDDFERFRAFIEQYRPMETRASYPIVLIIPMVAALAGVFLLFQRSTDPRVVAFLGLALSAFMVYSFWKILSSPLYDKHTKRVGWVYLVVALRILLKALAAFQQLK